MCRYQTLQYYNSQAALAAPQQHAAVTVTTEDDGHKSTVQIDLLEKYRTPIDQLSNGLSKARESVQRDTERILKHLEWLESIQHSYLLTLDLTLHEDESGEEKSPDVDVISALNHWRRLISIGSLREIPSGDLEESFLNVTKEIKDVQNSLDDEKLMEQFMSDVYAGAAVAKQQSAFICPSIYDSNGDSDSEKKHQDSPANERDLEEYLHEFENKFGNRVQGLGIHALLPDSVKDLENLMIPKISIILEDMFDVVDELGEKLGQTKTGDEDNNLSSSSSEYVPCIDAEFVTTLVEAGLKALLSHGDVREALRKMTLQLDAGISEEELILDADLPRIDDSHHAGPSNNGAMKTINIRTLVDTPLLAKSVDWIDHMVDVISGYNDEFDQYLDTITSYHGTNSVGEVVVETVLERAGRFGDVNIKESLKSIIYK